MLVRAICGNDTSQYMSASISAVSVDLNAGVRNSSTGIPVAAPSSL